MNSIDSTDHSSADTRDCTCTIIKEKVKRKKKMESSVFDPPNSHSVVLQGRSAESLGWGESMRRCSRPK